MTIILLALAALGAYSYWRFRKNLQENQAVARLLEQRYAEQQSDDLELAYAGALMQCQRYASALALFKDLESSGRAAKYPFLHANMEFCREPHPLSSGTPQDMEGDWLHYLLVSRLGKRRHIAIPEDVYLQAALLYPRR